MQDCSSYTSNYEQEAGFSYSVEQSTNPPYNRQIFFTSHCNHCEAVSCNFDAADVNIETGEIPFDKVTIEERPYLLYEYPLPRFLQHTPKDLASVLSTKAWESFIRMDILVINSSAFSDLFNKARCCIQITRSKTPFSFGGVH